MENSFHIFDEENKYFIPDGFISKWAVRCKENQLKLVTCKISYACNIPYYHCVYDNDEISGTCPTVIVKKTMQSLECVGKKKYSGYEFFGLKNQKLKVPNIMNSGIDSALQDITNIMRRKSGPTSQMKDKRDKNKRNEKINNIVYLSSQGDILSYINFLVENDPDVIQNSILSIPDYSAYLLHTISKQSLPIKFDEVESAKLLLCKNNLTEREYKRVKKFSRKRNVFICPYEKVTAYIKTLDTG